MYDFLSLPNNLTFSTLINLLPYNIINPSLPNLYLLIIHLYTIVLTLKILATK